MDQRTLTQQLLSLSQGHPRQRYSRQGVLGKGSFGEVFKAVDLHTSKLVAMKKMVYHPSELRCMLREVTHLKACVNHPNIVEYQGVFNTDSALFMVMEYVDGTTAFGLVDYTPVTPSQIALITREVLMALDFIHTTLQVIHHDLKLQNILISRSGQVKVADFGLSISIHDKKEDDVEFQGTAQYKAPDVLRTAHYTQTIDIWALGICIYALAMRKLPYPGFKFQELERAIYHNKQTPRLLYPYPEAMQYFVLECLKDQQDRPQASELLRHVYLESACAKGELAALVQHVTGKSES